MVPGIILLLALLFVFCREFIHPRIHPLFTADNLNYAPSLYVHHHEFARPGSRRIPGQPSIPVHHGQIRNNREEKIDLPPDYSRINEYEKIESPEFTVNPNDLPPPYFENYNLHQ